MKAGSIIAIAIFGICFGPWFIFGDNWWSPLLVLLFFFGIVFLELWVGLGELEKESKETKEWYERDIAIKTRNLELEAQGIEVEWDYKKAWWMIKPFLPEDGRGSTYNPHYYKKHPYEGRSYREIMEAMGCKISQDSYSFDIDDKS